MSLLSEKFIRTPRKSNMRWELVPLSKRKALIELIEERLTEKGMTGRAFAQQIGVSPVWVSSFLNGFAVETDANGFVLDKDESGAKKPSKRTIVRPSQATLRSIAMVLGNDIFMQAQKDLEEAGAWPKDAIGTLEADLALEYEKGTALLWSARAKLIGLLAVAEHRNTALRSLCEKVQRDLREVAMAHPIGRHLVELARVETSGAEQVRERPLQSLANEVRPLLRHQIFAELAHMRLLAPYDAEFDPYAFTDMLQIIANDLALPATSINSLMEFLRDCDLRVEGRDSVAGALGRMHFPIDDARAVLVGHDPAGWFGFQYVAGAWLTKGLNSELPTSTDATFFGQARLAYKRNPSSVVAKGVSAAAAAVLFGPVVGLMPAMRSASSRLGATSQKPKKGESAPLDPVALDIARTALALGPDWTLVEVRKLQTFYVSIQADDEVEADLLPFLMPTEKTSASKVDEIIRALRHLQAEQEYLKTVDATDLTGTLSQLVDFAIEFRDYLQNYGHQTNTKPRGRKPLGTAPQKMSSRR